MATDFWASSHYKRWIVDRATMKQARAYDLQYVDDPDYLGFFAIYFANAISKLGKKLGLRQRVIATATVFFHRFYLKNSYCDTDPFIVIAACCYVAAKAEESPVHIKNVVSESRKIFQEDTYGIKNFPTDHTKLAEMEFYLVEDLECDLVVFHPYRTLLALTQKDITDRDKDKHSTGGDNASLFGSEEGEADETGVGVGDEEGESYWGEGKLLLGEDAIQTAWFIINDTFRSDLCLLHPPHIIAVAALYLTLILHEPTRNHLVVPNLTHINPSLSSSALVPSAPTGRTPITPTPTPTVTPRRSPRQAQLAASVTSTPQASVPKKAPVPQDPVSWFADLHISLPLIATVAQEILSLYTLWARYKEDGSPSTKSQSQGGQSPANSNPHSASASPAKRSAAGSVVGTPVETGLGISSSGMEEAGGLEEIGYVTPGFLSKLLLEMRERRFNDVSLPTSARPVAINKMLERTQAAG